MVLFNCLSVYPPSAINDDDRMQKNNAIQKCSDFPRKVARFDFVNLPASGEKLDSKRCFVGIAEGRSFGNRLKPVLASDRLFVRLEVTEGGTRSTALGVFILCAPLASTRGGALDPTLHSQSLVARHGLWLPLAFLRDHLPVEPGLCFSDKPFFWRQVFRRYICTANVHSKPCLFQLTIQI